VRPARAPQRRNQALGAVSAPQRTVSRAPAGWRSLSTVWSARPSACGLWRALIRWPFLDQLRRKFSLMACRSRPCSNTPRAFPVALGWPIACHRGHRACGGNLHRCHPGCGQGLNLAAGCCAPCRNRRSGPPGPGWRWLPSAAPMLEPPGGDVLLTLLRHRPAGALVLATRQPVAAGDWRRLVWACRGAGRRCGRLSLKADDPGALPADRPHGQSEESLPGVLRHGDQAPHRNCPRPRALVATCALSLVQRTIAPGSGRESRPAGAKRPLPVILWRFRSDQPGQLDRVLAWQDTRN